MEFPISREYKFPSQVCDILSEEHLDRANWRNLDKDRSPDFSETKSFLFAAKNRFRGEKAVFKGIESTLTLTLRGPRARTQQRIRAVGGNRLG
ncbi:MAG: hypothetical protein WBW53_00960 [Terriglobales bacterium]